MTSVNIPQKKVGTFLNEPNENDVTFVFNQEQIAINNNEASEECIMNPCELSEEIIRESWL